MRSGLAYEISRAKGTGLWTADLLTLKNPAWHSTFISKVLRALDESTEAFAREYIKIHKQAYPIPPAWVALQFTSFGDLIQIFSYLKETEIRRKISNRYGINHEVLLSWLKAIRVLRNGCAHHARIWNRNLAVQPAWPRSLARSGRWVSTWEPADEIEIEQFTQHRNLGDGQLSSLTFYSAACVMCYLIDQINPNNTFRIRLLEAINSHPPETAIEAGFPSNWKTEPLWHIAN